MVLKYITFKTSEAFEKWQEENPTLIIHSVNPIASDIKMSEASHGNYSSYDGKINVSVFVLYH